MSWLTDIARTARVARTARTARVARTARTARVALALPAVALVALVACAGGEDVTIETGKTSSASTPCVVTPGEDVCSNLAKYAGPTTSAKALSSAQAIVDFADLARVALVALDGACIGVLDDLGAARPLDDEAGLPRARTAARCDAARAALARLPLGELRIQVGTPACTNVRGRACGGAPSVERESCPPPPLTITLAAGATPEATKAKEVLERRFGAVFGFKSTLEGAAAAVSTFAGGSAALAELRAACAPELSALAAAAVADLQEAASISGELTCAVAR